MRVKLRIPLITLSSLHVYPVKSCRGVTPRSWPLDAFGLRHDRRFMVVDELGAAITQREVKRLALVSTHIEGEASSGERVVLEVPGHPPLSFEAFGEGPRRIVEIFSYHGAAVDMGDEVAAVLSAFLGVGARLVRVSPDHQRRLDPRYFSGDAHTGFADGFPLLITSEASLQELNARLEVPVGMERFRPNLVVTGCAPFEEDEWRRVRLGAVEIVLVKPCARCVITTVDPSTGTHGGVEPLRTLATFRRKPTRATTPSSVRAPAGVLFGQNAVALGLGVLELGSAVEVLERGRA